ncbi:SPFH domain-containing protein [Corynebacterium pseudotuberculosis]|uniref:SPFH/Band 7/PHB domain protein n=1 Tax=Corynebacterium pseudotuberculosis (strain C231) TaxID=681645 RepID=D9QAG6_CORP2|nr:SPFH domain-containing protein [Corynebacterium pseudotuberculosis]ADL10542.1 SPFH/Band 7/PHB domain protein [Corynebacterium pseudotuberculosis C231]ADO26341.1 SPFH/Band 7/PHB domain protein [Corynebacterium pseudotuberculosis I19]AEK92404.1 SPFH domain, band 7 integral membrane protein [Corynebacterium pseudotuberculosis PAT10]AEP70316.1 SPFH domain, band 7 integral membrane protein [Corynebacterium pseudotuberculosis 42/02-A]AFF22225.1 SPFH domain, band 7 integral membrane protein [Coryn
MSFIFLAVVVVFVALLIAKSIVIIPQGEAAVIERLGRYTKTISGGVSLLVPFIDRVRAKVDTRERVVSFPPQAVITQDNLTVAIDTVVTFQINDAARAIYGVDNYIVGVEQISVATLRDVVGGMTLEETLTSREVINRRLRGELDAATTKWGLRISRVELKAIDPPPSIQQSMEMQMKADREKRAMILTAEGRRESDIRTAEGEKQAKILAAEGEKHAAILAAEAEREATILRAEGDRAARYLEAQGEARAIQKVNAAIKSARVTPEVLAYQYLEKLPKLAEGNASTMWMIPSQFGDSLEQFAKALAKKDDDGVFRYESSEVDQRSLDVAEEDDHEDWFKASSNPEIEAAVAAAKAVANKPVDEPTGVMSSSSKEKARNQPAIEPGMARQTDDLLLENPETLA